LKIYWTCHIRHAQYKHEKSIYRMHCFYC